MNEKEIKKLIKESVLSPSDKFTEEVMKKVKHEKAASRRYLWNIVFITISCIIILLLSTLITFPKLMLYSNTIEVSPVYIQFFCVIFVLYEVYQILEMKKNIRVAN